MLRIILTACILFSFCTTLSAGTVKIHGKVTNPLAGEIKFTSYEGYLEFTPKEHIARLDKDGRFSISFDVPDKYNNINFQNGDQGSELLLKDGDDLEMTFDGKDFDKTMHYTGVGAEAANFTAKHVLEIGSTMQYGATIQPLFIKEPGEFLEGAKTALQKELDFIQANKKGVPDAFIRYWTAMFIYDNYYFMQNYPFMHEMYKTKSSSVVVPKENYKVAYAVPEAFNDDYLSITSYRIYVSDVFNAKVGGMDSLHKIAYELNDSASILAKKKLPAKTKEYYFAYKLYRGMKQSSVGKSDSEYNNYKKMFVNSEYLPALDKAINIKRKLGAGQPALDFEFTSLDGKKMKLSDFKGKVVYMDFWASWCGPCMRELPYARKVEEHFKDKDVIFLNVSIDEDQEAWKKAIEKNKIDGVHVCEPGGWKSRIAGMYGVQSVPSYFLVDRQGKFITETTPRPSDTNTLISMIEKALQ